MSKELAAERSRLEEGFRARYGALNESQKRAVDTIDGPVLVLAGPGSGKTEILSLRVANILRQTDTTPNSILCLTFTDAAAANMRARLAGLIGAAAYKVAIYTFHSFCGDILERYPEYFFGGAAIAPADDVTRLDVLQELFNALPFDHPLRSYHPEQGYTYLRAVVSAIGDCKKGGLSPEEYMAVMEHNERWYERINPIIHEAFSDRLSKATFGKAQTALRELEAMLPELASDPFPSFQRSVLEAVCVELGGAIAAAEASDSNESLKRFKSRRTKKNDAGMQVLADSVRHEKLKAVGPLYAAYRDEMYKRGCYDFDDMILDCVSGLEKHATLRFELQERFQYVLVDEFQDTNDAQMRLIKSISNTEVTDGRPNIMAVGDDDQAIYRFQGADISNVLDFSRLFRDPAIITMTENYRSSQAILDIARAVVLRGEDRLENAIESLSKELQARGVNAAHVGGTYGDAITYQTYDTSAHEYADTAKRIATKIAQGIDPDDIAIIARKHAHLEAILPYMRAENIPVRYERRQNVFEQQHVAQLTQLARFITTGNDALLSEIMSYPFWGIDRAVVWEISVKAYKERESWLEVMRKSEHSEIKAIADFLIECIQRATYESAERMIDLLVGEHVRLLEEDEDDEGEEFVANTDATTPTFRSPFREYYFKQSANPDTSYLQFLSGLRVFVHAVREHQSGVLTKLADVVRFVDIHKQHNIPLLDQSPFLGAAKSVTLLSAHKAKGLEYDTVYVISCTDEDWTSRGRGSLLNFPMNLPLTPESDTLDDQMRLLYVALTRAKKELHISAHARSESGRMLSPLRFLVPGETDIDKALIDLDARKKIIEATDIDSVQVLQSAFQMQHAAPYVDVEQAMLLSLVKDYKMSVTHLNNFLDLSKGGPQAFIEQNLLHFPQAKTGSAAYGTAMHAALEHLFSDWKQSGALPPVEILTTYFEKALQRERLPEHEYNRFLAQGTHALASYYEACSKTWSATDKVEVNFSQQGVVLGDAHLSGKIDRMAYISSTEVEVRDIKTGKGFSAWDEAKGEYDEMKLIKYRRQLLFYRLLVEHSRDYHMLRAKHGALEFVEPSQQGVCVTLGLDLSDEETERLSKLIQIVYKKICALDFPSIDAYSPDVEGSLKFEEDLLSEAI